MKHIPDKKARAAFDLLYDALFMMPTFNEAWQSEPLTRRRAAAIRVRIRKAISLLKP